MFTDSDWAGRVYTAKLSSGCAICIGEHVFKAYCRQQKVVALSSAEAELYAMVAASAETLAMAAYAKDIGVSLEANCSATVRPLSASPESGHRQGPTPSDAGAITYHNSP